ncbi:TrbC/VirB2 family protein [Candidatus Uhrbacteria bacterium]|nr:TrbC/VirB2 family protein [Candidatus Uhrbacteria bacterium]
MFYRSWLLISIIASFAFLPSVVFGAEKICADNASEKEVNALYDRTKTDSTKWVCQRIDLNNQTQKNKCLVGGCPKYGKDIRCCVPGTGDPKIDAPKETSATGTTVGGPSGSIPLDSCIENGKCSLDDIIRTGVGVSQFLFGLSGAIFLGIFVYAGLLYLLSGGNSKNAGKGKEMMVQAVIGMIIIFAAGTIVRFIHTSLTRQTPGETQCERELGRQGYSCQVIGGGESELEARGCRFSKCQEENVFCCPIDAPVPQKKDDAGKNP